MSTFSRSLHTQLFSTMFALIAWTVLALAAWMNVIIMLWKNFDSGITMSFILFALGFSVFAFDGWCARIKGKAPIHAFVRKCLGIE